MSIKRKPKLVQVDPDIGSREAVQRFLDHFQYTMREAAEILGVDFSTISKWLSGDRRPPATALMIMQELIRKNPKEAANV